jgi:L-threonylcarbamoyladenylate synthase
MDTEVSSAAAPDTLRYAGDVLRHNGLVAFPTDTVYGVAAHLSRPEAIRRLYVVKGRSTDKAIAVLVGRVDDLASVTADLTPAARALARRFWPGPLTLVLARHPGLPAAVSALATVGVRLPDHPVARALLEQVGPLAVTSANRTGEANPLTAADVLAQLGGRIELIVDGGRVPGGVPSTVVDCTGPVPQVLREGPVTAAAIAAALDSDLAQGGSP